MSTVGRKLLSSLVYSGSVQDYIKLGLGEHLFQGAEKMLFGVILDHLSAYGKIPSVSTINGMVNMEDALVEAPEPPKYYMDETEKRYLQLSLKEVMIKTDALLKVKDSTGAMEVISKGVADLYAKQHRNHLFDFRDSAKIIAEAYHQQKKFEDGAGLMFGWPTLDNMTGGLRGGDFCSFVGRPAAGKTFKLLYNALNAWNTEGGRVPLFVSMEMNQLIISQRLAAMQTKKNLTHLLKAEMTSNAFKQMMVTLHSLKKKEHPLWVVDGNLTATVDDIVLLARQLNPSAVYVDGAYLLRHPNQKISKFERISDNAEMLKQRIATDMDIPVVCSYQLNREAAKKKKKNDEQAGLEDIAGSDAIGQISTVVMGLFQEESIETMKRRRVNILKGRNGEIGQFDINWAFDTMDFTEYVEPSISEMQFLG